MVEFNASSSFKEQLETMSSTGVYVSVHTSNLANAPFLQPGSAVVELLQVRKNREEWSVELLLCGCPVEHMLIVHSLYVQKNWIWDNLDRNFVVQTEMMGDIHHFAWRARHRNQTVYVHKRDAERFGRWPSVMCDTVRWSL